MTLEAQLGIVLGSARSFVAGFGDRLLTTVAGRLGA